MSGGRPGGPGPLKLPTVPNGSFSRPHPPSRAGPAAPRPTQPHCAHTHARPPRSAWPHSALPRDPPTVRQAPRCMPATPARARSARPHAAQWRCPRSVAHRVRRWPCRWHWGWQWAGPGPCWWAGAAMPTPVEQQRRQGRRGQRRPPSGHTAAVGEERGGLRRECGMDERAVHERARMAHGRAATPRRY